MKRFFLLILCILPSLLFACSDKTQQETMISVKAGGKEFEAELYDNEASTALLEILPLTIEMRELNGNEKYYYLSNDLKTDPSVPDDGIHCGDIMLFGSDCLVIFYEDFTTNYSYTPIGRIINSEGLKEALGASSIVVAFLK